MEGLIISLLLTLSLTSLCFWWRDSKSLTRERQQRSKMGEDHIRLKDSLTLLRYKRYEDFATRWKVNLPCVEAAFVTLNLDQEDGFRLWTQNQFIDWYNSKLTEESLGFMVDDIFKQDWFQALAKRGLLFFLIRKPPLDYTRGGVKDLMQFL